MSAAEEKAMLAAKFNSVGRGSPNANGNGNGSANGGSSTPPSLDSVSSGAQSATNSPLTPAQLPPLMPRPPDAYIQETREEDARTIARAQTLSAKTRTLRMTASGDDLNGSKLLRSQSSLDSRPRTNGVTPPPPLPPKVLMDE
jgi:hypothetical protein